MTQHDADTTRTRPNHLVTEGPRREEESSRSDSIHAQLKALAPQGYAVQRAALVPPGPVYAPVQAKASPGSDLLPPAEGYGIPRSAPDQSLLADTQRMLQAKGGAGGEHVVTKEGPSSRQEAHERFLEQVRGPSPFRAPVQARGNGDGKNVHAAAAKGVSGSGGQLPHLDKIQKAFGKHDVSGVDAHVGGKAAEACGDIGAVAYASGNKTAFVSSPDLHTAAHEAAHTVQQRAGVSLKGGIGEVGDQYEQHADRVAEAVVGGRSAEPLLAEFAGGSSSTGLQMKGRKKKKNDWEMVIEVTPVPVDKAGTAEKQLDVAAKQASKQAAPARTDSWGVEYIAQARDEIRDELRECYTDLKTCPEDRRRGLKLRIGKCQTAELAMDRLEQRHGTWHSLHNLSEEARMRAFALLEQRGVKIDMSKGFVKASAAKALVADRACDLGLLHAAAKGSGALPKRPSVEAEAKQQQLVFEAWSIAADDVQTTMKKGASAIAELSSVLREVRAERAAANKSLAEINKWITAIDNIRKGADLALSAASRCTAALGSWQTTINVSGQIAGPDVKKNLLALGGELTKPFADLIKAFAFGEELRRLTATIRASEDTEAAIMNAARAVEKEGKLEDIALSLRKLNLEKAKVLSYFEKRRQADMDYGAAIDKNNGTGGGEQAVSFMTEVAILREARTMAELEHAEGKQFVNEGSALNDSVSNISGKAWESTYNGYMQVHSYNRYTLRGRIRQLAAMEGAYEDQLAGKGEQ